MDFFETIFSFVPLIMIVLFFTRIAKAAGKKNRSKSQKTEQPAEAGRNKQKKPAQPVSQSMREKHRWKSRRPGTVQAAPASALKAKTETAPGPEALPHKKPAVQVPAQAMPDSRRNDYFEKKKQPQKTPVSTGSLKRLKTLPELQRAVLWAEILGKPKGFE